MIEKIVEACHYLLNNYPEAQASKSYLDTRLSLESQKTFGFGYFPGAKDISVLFDLVGEEALQKERLFFTRDIEDSLSPRKMPVCYFQDHPLIMPFRDPYGAIVGLVGRSLLSDEERKPSKLPKYKNTAECIKFKKGNLLFGLYENKRAILEQGCVRVVEGQFDMIKAYEIGIRNIVALGNNTMTAYQFSLISRYTDNILLLLDNDEGGETGRERIISRFGKFANIRNLYLPSHYKDIDEYITKGEIGDHTQMSFVVKE